MNIKDITSSIQQTADNGRTVLIAIEGFGGSGKTTIAQRLKEALGDAYIVSIDDFIVKSKLADTSWDNGVFDIERLERQVLLPAASEKEVAYQKLIWASDTLSEPVIVPNVKYLIIEGITSYHPKIAKYYDYKIWVDTPMEVAKQRGHARDGSNENAQYWDLWAENDVAYQKTYHPEINADYIIDNSEDK